MIEGMAENVLFEKYGKTYDAGKIIFREGEEGDKMYIIQDGTVRISKNIDNTDYTLAVLGKGEFFGEMALVSRTLRSATATVGDTARLLEFDRKGFLGMIEKNAKIALNIIDKLCRRLQQANQQIHHLKKRDEEGLIALNLHYAFSESGNAVLDKMKTVRELSLSLEIPAERISQYLEKFGKGDIIQITGNTITLMNAEKLMSLSGMSR